MRLPPSRSRAAADVSLRLAIGREGVGLELARPARIACLQVTELSTTFHAIRFPIDVSGGVTRFRHRRGRLQRLGIELRARDLERWAAPLLSGLVSVGSPNLWTRIEPSKVTVCISTEHDADAEASSPAPAVAFDVHALMDEDVVLVVSNARGVNLAAPATAIAIASVDAALGRAAERIGAMFIFRRPASRLAQALLPDAGARVPSADDIRWAAVTMRDDAWFLHASADIAMSAPSDPAVRAQQIAAMLREGDDALVAGNPDGARAAYLGLLERAPGHAEIVRRIAEIDARVPGREEAALAMLADAGEAHSGTDAASHRDLIRGQLLGRTGSLGDATACFGHAADLEVAPVLASRACELAARAARDPQEAVRWLDRAVALAPRAVGARWARVNAQLSLGRPQYAIADVEQLEALARGGRRKHDIALRAGRAWQAVGLHSSARPLFERALRHAPDDAQALAGLGTALARAGAAARGATLLARALEIAQARGESSAPTALELARTLADGLNDLPTAIAQAASISSDTAEAPIARGLEGRWRAKIGDFVGASLAYSKMCDLAASLAARPSATSARPAADEQARCIAELLREAAEMELEHRGNPSATQRHLTVALELQPGDPDLRTALLRVGNLMEPSRAAPAKSLGSFERQESEEEESDIEALRAARVEELTRQLHADPKSPAVADELASLLELLGRGHELLALLSARLEDSPPENRPALLARVRATLERLAESAERAGRADEASLFRSALAAWVK
jgi:tetratricopeptide (TPR) repeat protein